MMKGNVPPFMKGKGAEKPDPRMDARKRVAAKRLEKMKGSPKGK